MPPSRHCCGRCALPSAAGPSHLVLYSKLAQVGRGNPPEAMPLDRDAVARRCKAPGARPSADSRSRAPGVPPTGDHPCWRGSPRSPAGAVPRAPGWHRRRFPRRHHRNWNDIAKVVPDPEAESGSPTAWSFRRGHGKVCLPMPWGLYDQLGAKDAGSSNITADMVPGPGYHWYRLGSSQSPLHSTSSGAGSSGGCGQRLRPKHPDQQWEVWARIKFEAPASPRPVRSTERYLRRARHPEEGNP